MGNSLIEGTRFEQVSDSDDPRFTWLRVRVPNGGMPDAAYGGVRAADRLRRFCQSFIDGAHLVGANLPPQPNELLVLQRLSKTARTGLGDAVVLRGWIFVMAQVPSSVDYGGQLLQLTARLWPRERSTVEADWRFVGIVASMLGAPRDPVTSLEETPPSDPIVWRWTAMG